MGDHERLLLMGCGAVGRVLAAGLLRASHKVTIVTYNNQITQAINLEGLRVTTPEGVWTVPATRSAGAPNGWLDLRGGCECSWLDSQSSRPHARARLRR